MNAALLLLLLLAAGPASAGPFDVADSMLEQAVVNGKRVEDCSFAAEKARGEHARLDAEARRSQTPQAYSGILAIKRQRVKRAQDECAMQMKLTAESFDRAMDSLAQVEPKSLKGIAERRKRIGEARARYNESLKRLNAGAGKKS